MTITVDTREYLNSHGREPGQRLKGESGGPADWWFDVNYTRRDGTSDRAKYTFRGTYRGALAKVTRAVRTELAATDATIEVLP